MTSLNFSTQVHDFDPGIESYPTDPTPNGSTPSGLVWTSPLPKDAVHIDLANGRARMSVKNLNVQDYFDIPNAFLRVEDPVSARARCSFDIHWSGPITSRGPVTGPPGVNSRGHLLLNQATMTWSASNHLGFRFESYPARTTSVFAQLGQVRNGVFA